ncbi:MAG: 3-phosphoshikimate 1-carboxyvinyltransferase [Chloroflexi bacterium]|nr:3-phosphoshikimate 1-carboxyvinyltransferase [Chloroflexota bacterium]
MASPDQLVGEITPPGDKSLSHRAVIFNAIAQGRARVTNFLPGADCQATIACMRALGVSIQEDDDERELVVEGVGKEGLREAETVLDAQNSGTTMRLLAGLLAAQPFFSVITGDVSLRSRPMGRIAVPLRQMGASVWGRQGGSLPPLAIAGGRLSGIDYQMPVASAQLKSALLLAGLYARGETHLEEPAPSRDHTERMLEAMGVELRREGNRVALVPPSQPLRALDIHVPGDISSAAFWLVAGTIHPRARIVVRGVGMNPTRTGILDVLRAMGAMLKVEKAREERGELVADVMVESRPLRGVEIGGDLIPRLIDEAPIIALAAAAAQGTTIIKDAAELRVKESDRISTTVAELRRFGVNIEEMPDGMIIRGGGELQGATCKSYGDHRLAMTLAMAGLVARGETFVRDAEIVDVSYPHFWEDVERLASSSPPPTGSSDL